MFSIRGDTDLPEIELSHLDGHRGSKPVRIGNGAAFHKQLDIYGELFDSLYLYQKHGKPSKSNQYILSWLHLILSMGFSHLSIHYNDPLLSIHHNHPHLSIHSLTCLTSSKLRPMALHPRARRLRLHHLEGTRHVDLGSARAEAKLRLLEDTPLGRPRPRAPPRRQTQQLPLPQPPQMGRDQRPDMRGDYGKGV